MFNPLFSTFGPYYNIGMVKWRVNIHYMFSFPKGGCIMNVSGVSEVIVKRKGSTRECCFFFFFAEHTGFMDVGGLKRQFLCGWEIFSYWFITSRGIFILLSSRQYIFDVFTRLNIWKEISCKQQCKIKKKLKKESSSLKLVMLRSLFVLDLIIEIFS